MKKKEEKKDAQWYRKHYTANMKNEKYEPTL